MKIRAFESGTEIGTFPCGNYVTQQIFEKVGVDHVDSYVNALVEDGLRVNEDRCLAQNRFVTLISDEGVVHLTYLIGFQKLFIVSDPLKDHEYKLEEPEYAKVTELSLAVMARDYSVQPNLDDGNGLSYVITLEDGRYIIFDGGYVNCGDDDALYNYMKTHNKRPDGEIVIAAWMFTHADRDHVGAFREFSLTYASKVKVEWLVYNTGTAEMFHPEKHNPFLEIEMGEYRRKYYPNTKVMKPHTGQHLTFCNTLFEVIYTQEVFAPKLLPWENDGSFVVRMHFNGKTVLFMGDCESSSSKLICDIYGEALKSDIFQVNHHGFSGGIPELYDRVSPTWTLWTTSQVAFEKRITGIPYQFISHEGLIGDPYMFKKVGREHCLIADGPIKILTIENGELHFEYAEPDFENHSI